MHISLMIGHLGHGQVRMVQLMSCFNGLGMQTWVGPKAVAEQQMDINGGRNNNHKTHNKFETNNDNNE